MADSNAATDTSSPTTTHFLPGGASVQIIELSWFDILTLVSYFALIGILSFVISRQARQKQAIKASSEAFFLAERSVPWWAVAASLFASNIGTEHFVGLAGSAAKDGISVAWYELGAIPVILLLGFVLLPTYLNAQIMTMPDYLEQRYSVKCRQVVVILSLCLYVFTKVSATLFAGQIIVVELLDMNPYVAVILLVVFTSAYTVSGGLEAVIYTEVMQTVVLVIGGLIVLGFTLSASGGMQGIREELPESYFHLFRPATDDTYPWTGFIFGYYCVSIWYWGCDQVIVQRALAARNIAHGQAGCIGAALLKFLPFILMILPGLGAKSLIVKTGLVSADPNANVTGLVDFDRVYPWLVKTVVPIHARGFIIAGMLASLMSSLASVFNSASTIFTLDIWKVWYPNSSELKLVQVGRVAVAVLGVSALLWLPIIPLLGDRLFLIIQKPPAYVAPPVVVVFLWGVLSNRPRARGAELALAWGLFVGGLRFTFEVIEHVSGHTNEPGALFGFFTQINFLHFAIISFISSTSMLFSVSYRAARAGAEPPSPRLLYSAGLYEQLMSHSRQVKESEKLHGNEIHGSNGHVNGHAYNGNGKSSGFVQLELTELNSTGGGAEDIEYMNQSNTSASRQRRENSELSTGSFDDLTLEDDLGRRLHTQKEENEEHEHVHDNNMLPSTNGNVDGSRGDMNTGEMLSAKCGPRMGTQLGLKVAGVSCFVLFISMALAWR